MGNGNIVEMKKYQKKEKYLERLFVVFVFGLLLAWSCSIPVMGAPDEGMKMDICRYIAENHKLPHGGDPSIRNGIWGISYAFMPILSYMISAVFVKMASYFTTDLMALYVAARFTSVLCGTAMAVMVIKIGHKLFCSAKQRWIFIVSATMLPQVVYLGSYLNNDSLALFSISVIIYAWILGLESEWNWKSVCLLGVGIGICALSYYNAYGYLLTSVTLYVTACLIKGVKGINWQEFWKKGLVIAAIAIAIAGWWFVRNALIYDGDFLGMQTENEYAQEYAMDGFKPSQINNSNNIGESLPQMLVQREWIKYTLMSFVGILGTGSYLSLARMYWIYLISIVFALLMCLLRYGSSSFRKTRIRDKKRILLEVTFGINMVIPVLLSVYYSYYNDFQPQGRYIMPMLIPLMYFVTTGGCTFVDFVTTKGIMEKISTKEKIRDVVYRVILLCGMLGPVLCLFLLKKYLY